jgi:O-antigen ligase
MIGTLGTLMIIIFAIFAVGLMLRLTRHKGD